MEIWVTKYALTKGIQKYEATIPKGGMVRVDTGVGYVLYFQYFDYRLSETAAIKKVFRMIADRQRSIKKEAFELADLRTKFKDRLANIEAAKAKA